MNVRVLRLLALLWAVASAAGPGAFAILHARAEALAAGAVPGHVESEGGPDCPPVHHGACVTCSRVNDGSVRPVGRQGALLATRTDQPLPSIAFRIRSSRPISAAAPPRAPPLA